MSEDISQGNKLIAEFMGFTVKDFSGAHWRYIEVDRNTEPYYNWQLIKECQYHSSWDWLMPVVEKIEEMGYQTLLKKHMNRRKTDHEMLYYDIENGDCIIEADFTYKSKIDCVYQATISFIQWYNSQTPKEVNK